MHFHRFMMFYSMFYGRSLSPCSSLLMRTDGINSYFHRLYKYEYTMATFQVSRCIVDLNNGALSHFLNGDYDKAIEMLRTAFETFDKHRIVLPQQSFPQQQTESESSFNFVECQKPQEELPTMMDCDVVNLLKEKSVRSHLHIEPTCALTSSPSTIYSLYNRALVISEQDDYSLLVKYQHQTALQ